MGAPQQILMAGGAAADANALAIYNAILAGGKGAFWNMEENSAGTQFLDASGNANHLTTRDGASVVATSTVTTSTNTLLGRNFNTNVAQRTAYIPRANTNLDLPNTDWTFGGWWQINGSTSGSARYLMGRLGAYSAAKYQAQLWISSADDTIHFQASSDGNGTLTEVASGVTGTGAAWLMIACTLDRTNNLLRLRIKGVSRDVNQTGAFASALFTTANNSNFCINHILNNDSTFSVAGSRENVGLADQCFYMAGHALTEAEFLYLYNGLVGKTWAQIAADAGH